MKKFIRPENCIINDMFMDGNNPEFLRNEYCEKNCNYRCVNGKIYKTTKESS